MKTLDLLSQFISEKVWAEYSLEFPVLTTYRNEQGNLRTDDYGEKLYLLRRIATEIRTNVPKDFVLGVKLNSGDFIDNKTVSSSEEKALQDVRDIISWELFDFLEISGGDYESPGSWISQLHPPPPRVTWIMA